MDLTSKEQVDLTELKEEQIAFLRQTVQDFKQKGTLATPTRLRYLMLRSALH